MSEELDSVIVSPEIEELEVRINVKFKDVKLLLQAVTHRSYLNEHPDLGMGHNERLEFLGDAVLELVVTDYLYHKYPDKPEGELTSVRSALVNTISIGDAAAKIGVNEFLRLSRGEAKDTGRARSYILANSFEAIIGAIYLDQGYQAAHDFISAHLFPKAGDIVTRELWRDSKSFFQEKAQEEMGITPSYVVVREDGPDHAKIFTVAVFVGKVKIAEGSGLSKQEAETDAARKGLEKKGWVKSE